MEARSEFVVSDDGQATCEVATIVHEGKECSAMGAYISDNYIVGYISKPDNQGNYWLTTWSGERIGGARFVSTWRMSRSWRSSTMSQIEVYKDGKVYTGRGCGVGAIWRGDIKKGK